MRTKACWSVLTVVALLAACGGGTDEKQDAGKRDGSVGAADLPAATDMPAADLAPDQPEAGQQPDRAADVSAGDAGQADRAPADVVPDTPALEVGPPDLAVATEAGAIEVRFTVEASTEAGAVDLGAPADASAEAGKQDSAELDAASDVVAAEAPAPANYTCRDDSDCCIVVDTCAEVAHLYSLAPGATGPPSIPPSTMCVPCIPPAVQVWCDLGQCVGEKVTVDFSYMGPLRQNHCGRVTQPDAGAASPYQPAYAGRQPTSWGC
jgi:hypothetical protein